MKAAPTRLIAAFLAQKSRLLSALRDEGGLFENRFLQRLVIRERAAVGEAATEASTMQQGLAEVRDFVRRETAPDDDTPGVIDATESRELMKKISKLGVITTHHADQLKALV